MNLETKITIYKFTPQLFTLTHEEEQEERNKLLLEKLQKLPHQELQVVRAVIMENKKYKEAAEELHISVNTLKTHLTRALKQLRKEYNLHSLFY